MNNTDGLSWTFYFLFFEIWIESSSYFVLKKPNRTYAINFFKNGFFNLIYFIILELFFMSLEY